MHRHVRALPGHVEHGRCRDPRRGLVSGSLGAVNTRPSGVMAGAVVDRVGFKRSACGLDVLILVGSVLLCTRSFIAQVGAQVILSLLAGGWQILLQRFCIHYVPVELFGTWNGFLQSLLGLGQLLLTPSTLLFTEWVRPRLQDNGAWLATRGPAGWRSCSCTSGRASSLRATWSMPKHPMPLPNSLRLADVRAAIDSVVWSGDMACTWG
ncbi:unnamed protein product [Prorocentrum cordatum]|uniref:Solute carrier family 40 protein n=1 Tax=Prorocentrum cordatum TaxID=2364126 RepID=A0ABN9YEI1_9DINO|nr:unnamed protein product [Polarella glacialis]